MSQKWFKIRRRLFYRFHGKNAYSIHSQHVYDYYTTSYLPTIRSGQSNVIEEFQKWCRKNFPRCIFVNYDLSDTGDLERLKKDYNRNIKYKNDDNVIVIYLNINVDRIREKLVSATEVTGNKYIKTFPSNPELDSKPISIDYIFVSPSIKVNKVGTYDSMASDHLPLWAELEI